MKNKFSILIILSLSAVFSVTAQQSSPPEARAPRPPRANHEAGLEWFDRSDANKNGTIERNEFAADAEEIFKEFDKNGDDVLDRSERPKPHDRPPRAEQDGREEKGGELRGDAHERHPPPPPFIMEGGSADGKLTHAEFIENAQRHFAATDKNGDGAISRDEAVAMDEILRERAPERRDDGFRPPPPPAVSAPTAAFLGAEMRFGDKLVKGAPFSAETEMENTRRLFDGTTVTTQNKGAIFRDGSGRTRREQTLKNVGGFDFGGQAQQLIYITDAEQNTQYFLDARRKTARRIPLDSSGNRPPQAVSQKEGNEKTESLGTKIIEGVSAQGTKTTIEIPAFMGGDRTAQIVTERWFSPELQTVVLTRQIDPLIGEQIFRLKNIKRDEPPRELFALPPGYKVEAPREENPRE